MRRTFCCGDMIIMLGLNRFVVNPQIPLRYAFDEDHDLDCVNPLFSMW